MLVQQNRFNFQNNAHQFKPNIAPSTKNSGIVSLRSSREFGKDITNIENINDQKVFFKKKVEPNSMECRTKLLNKQKIDLAARAKKYEVKVDNFKKIHSICNNNKLGSKPLQKQKFVNHNNYVMNKTISTFTYKEPKTYREKESKLMENIPIIEKKKSADETNAICHSPSKSLNLVNIIKEEEEKPMEITPIKDPQEVDEYFDDIVEEYFSNEKDYLPLPTYMESPQTDISNHMRSILNDWLLEVHLKYKFTHETIFLAVNLLDRYLSKIDINRNILQLVGVSALMIAGKYEEIYPPDLKVYSYITDDAYSVEEVKKMECDILKVLNFDTTITSPLKFVQIYNKLLHFGNTAFLYAEYLLDLSLMDVKMLKYLPSELAAASVWLGIKICEEKDMLKELIIHSRSSEDKIKACATDLVFLLQKYEKNSLKCIRQKYSLPKYGNVAKIKIEGKI